jgi:hypothetical protein
VWLRQDLAIVAGLWLVLAGRGACLWLIGFILGLGLRAQAMGLTRRASTTTAANSDVDSFAIVLLSLSLGKFGVD